MSASNLASLLRSCGDCEAAEPLFRRALKLAEQKQYLGQLFYSEGKYALAEDMLRQSLDQYELTCGPCHPDTVRPGIALTNCLSQQDRYDEAAVIASKVLRALEAIHGRHHPDTLAVQQVVDDLAAMAADEDLPPSAREPCVDPPGAITNSLGMKFVSIPAGDFLMGSAEDCPFGDPVEEFQHHVRITKPFLLGMHQVTQSQYERVTGENPSFFKGADRPVEHLTWSKARRFCELLTDLPEERAVGRRYRLPTEAEWEYACRAGTTTPFNTGDTLELHQARFATTSRSSPKPTAPVGSYPPNAWGLFDMHGNVWEWTADWYSADYFRESPVDDPQGPATGTHHTLRGGSASMESHECRTTYRGEADAVDGPETETGARVAFYGDLGVRVVCEVVSKPRNKRA